MKILKLFSLCLTNKSIEKDQIQIKEKRQDSECIMSLFQIDFKFNSDCRSYEQKKDQIDDNELNNYLKRDLSKTRRHAICEELAKNDSDNQLIEFQTFLLRELYFQSFPM